VGCGECGAASRKKVLPINALGSPFRHAPPAIAEPRCALQQNQPPLGTEFFQHMETLFNWMIMRWNFFTAMR
jgi:hypothetical protein